MNIGGLNAMDAGVTGIQKGMLTASQVAQRIAQNGATDTAQLTQDLANLSQSKYQVMASSKVVSAASEMMGSIIDMKV